MRILQVVGSLNRGGAETWLTQLLKHIDRTQFPIDFVVHTVQPGAYDKEVTALGSRIFPCLEPSNPFRYAINFHRILKSYGAYDCVHIHVHHFSGLVLMLAALHGIPVRIVHSHSDTRNIDHQASFLRKIYLAGMNALIQKFATHGIAVTENAALAMFSKKWKTDPRWNVFPLAIDLHPFSQEVDKNSVRAEFGIAPNLWVVGHVGRFVAVKNHCFLVDIAEHLCADASSILFLLVGDGPLRHEIESLVSSRGLSEHFLFAGIRTDVPRIMKGAMDCFVLPSILEGLPMALLEAQAAGLHCVVSADVSSEGDIGSSAVTRVALSEPAEVWAHCLQDAFLRSRKFDIPEVWKHSHSIIQGAKDLQDLYASLEPGTPTNSDTISSSTSALQ
jgi:glycosyltransferase involved in cell wall biosynthesis